jgi:hypothetical protein
VTVYVTSRCSKLEKILSLIHELGHHKGWIENNREPDPKVDEAMEAEEAGRRFRKRILDMEENDSLWWEQIYKDTNCKFGLDRLELQRQFDIWCYEHYYETGKDATKKEKKAKWKELKKG